MDRLIGKIVRYSQYIESHMIDQIYFHTWSTSTKKQAISQKASLQRLTLGDLFHMMIERKLVDKEFKNRTFACIKFRNTIIHELFEVPSFPNLLKRSKIILDEEIVKKNFKELKTIDKLLVRKNKKIYKIAKKYSKDSKTI